VVTDEQDTRRQAAAPAAEAEDSVETAPRSSPAPEGGGSPSIVIAGGEEQAVDPRAVTVARLVGMLWTAAVAVAPYVGVTIAWALGGIPSRVYLLLLVIGTVLLAATLTWAYKWPELHHRHLRYRVDDHGMRIRRGVLWRKVVSIPASRVQHTDVSQGPLQRQYDLATLTVHTAGTQGASISLEGLEQGVARRLRDHLLPDHVDDDDA
jgi:membrane protein YdbS with pleckstrin-like domain